MWDLIVSVPDHCLSFLLFSRIPLPKNQVSYYPGACLTLISYFFHDFVCLSCLGIDGNSFFLSLML